MCVCQQCKGGGGCQASFSWDEIGRLGEDHRNPDKEVTVKCLWPGDISWPELRYWPVGDFHQVSLLVRVYGCPGEWWHQTVSL